MSEQNTQTLDSGTSAGRTVTHWRRVRYAVQSFTIHLVLFRLRDTFCASSVCTIFTIPKFSNQHLLNDFSFWRLHHMNNNSMPLERFGRLFVLVTCWCMAVLVCISRTYLQYHSCAQVVIGGIVGCLSATAWFSLTHLMLTPYFPYVVSWWVSSLVPVKNLF